MALSKARNRERMRGIRLHKAKELEDVQPKVRYGIIEATGERVELDAEGNIMPEFT